MIEKSIVRADKVLTDFAVPAEGLVCPLRARASLPERAPFVVVYFSVFTSLFLLNYFPPITY